MRDSLRVMRVGLLAVLLVGFLTACLGSEEENGDVMNIDDNVNDGDGTGNGNENGDGSVIISAESLTITTGNYKIQPDLLDTYECWSYRVSLPSKRHAIRFEAVRGNGRFIHHMVLFRDINGDTQDGHFQCYALEKDWVYIRNFPLNWEDLALPPDAGFPIEDGDQIILQMHYYNPDRLTAEGNSSVTLYFAEELRPYDIGMLTLGSVDFDLEPGLPQVVVEAICDTNDLYPFVPEAQPLDAPVTMFSAFLHMHHLGSQIWTDVIRNGEVVGGEGSGQLGKNTNWEHRLPEYQPLNFVVQPGDVLKTTCVYDTSDQTDVVSFGQTAEDEMCFNFIYYFSASEPLPFLPPCGGDYPSP